MARRAPKSARRFHLPQIHWALLAKIGGATLAVLVVIAVVPPFRRAAALITSKVVLFVAAPLAPSLKDFNKLPETTTVVAADGSTLAQLDSSEKRSPVKLKSLPPHVKNAVLAAEDADFYHHGGIDPSAVLRAFIRTAQGSTQGGSTITQQLAKINYTHRQKTVLRKLREVLYASRLEQKYSKDQLLERYLNQVYFGAGAYGIGAAAQTFFGKDAAQLDPAEAAVLAGKIRSPEGLDPRTHPDKVKARRDQVLGNMHKHGWLKTAEFQAAIAEPLTLAPPALATTNSTKAPHFVEFVKREAAGIQALGSTPEARQRAVQSGGLKIESTLDPKVFDPTVAAVQHQLGQPDDPIGASASVAPGDGAIRSLFGGLDFATTQFDMSSRGSRQPGSSFKPFVYLAALRAGIDPRSVFNGQSPQTIPCYGKQVNNYAGEDAGPQVDLDTALAHSVNVVFVQVGCKAGVKNVLRAAQDDGVPPEATTAQGGIFLGGLDRGVSALTMASAYATFAAKGVYAKPYAILSIKDDTGKTIYTHKAETKQAFEPNQVGVLNNAMQRVVSEGTGRAAAIGRPVAGKTGTTSEYNDAWFAGYTPQLSTAVWVGYEPRKSMTNVHGRAVAGGTFPAMIFSELMKSALQGVKPEPIFTASPDSLQLQRLTTSTTSSSSTSSTSTTSTTAAPGATTSTTSPRTSSTTTSTPATTTTTSKKSTTTTTSPPPPTTTTSSTTTTSTTPKP